VMAALEPMEETEVPSIFDPPPVAPRTPNPDGSGAIAGFLASINFGRAQRDRARATNEKTASEKAASDVVAYGAVLLAAGHLLAAHGMPPVRADMGTCLGSHLGAAGSVNKWYHARVESCAMTRRDGVRHAIDSGSIG